MESSGGLEKAKKWVDIIAGLAVILTMLFIAFQWYEMHNSSVDTHDLAIAAKGQADATKGIVEEMKKSGNDTHELAVQAKNQADRTKDVADRALAPARATNE